MYNQTLTMPQTVYPTQKAVTDFPQQPLLFPLKQIFFN